MKQIPPCPVCNQPSRYDFSSRDLMFDHYERYDYHRCSNCDFIFQYPLPSPEQISAFYPNSYDIYEEQSRLKKVSSFRKSILKKYYGYSHLKTSISSDILCFITHKFENNYEVPFKQNGYLLDVGCGNGRYLDGMNKLGWKTQGVEFNEHAVSVCKLSNLEVHHGDLFSANFASDTFDVINVSHVVEHVPNPKEFFSELSRIIKKNGILIIKTPNSKAFGRSLFNTNWFPNEVPRHIYLFSEKNLSTLGHNTQFKMEQIITRTTVKLILNSLDYVTGNKEIPSKKIKWKRFIARIYVLIAQYKKQGDEIFAVFTKK
jgi:2-polyprenyl-3-methyl-5-hydroxy-6-metoxy-1,4-benzoquinol methylase